MFKENFHRLSLTKPDGRKLFLYARHPISRTITATNPLHDKLDPKPHFRYHPLRNEWVIYAAHRQGRTFLPPKDYSPLKVSVSAEFPTEMPPGDYDVAVFDNLFPSMTLAPEASVGVQHPARGACEVVVFTQDPDTSLGALPLDRIQLILEVLADRTRELARDPGIKYVLPFENRGVEQGVTLHHPHSQIYAYPFVPPIPASFTASMADYHRQHGHGMIEGILRDELADGRRVVARDEHAAAFIPAFARYPYETWIAPLRRAAWLHDLTGPELESLARVLRETLQKFDAMWKRPFPYLLNLYQAPVNDGPHPEWHTHLQVFPPYRTRDRLKYLAGTELGAGVYVNDSLPEEKAAELRSLQITATDTPVLGRAHGRVNLMGDHTDYNLGHVLPTLIPQSTTATLRLDPARSREVTLVSSRDPHSRTERRYVYTLGSEARATRAEDQWADYLMGVTSLLAEGGARLSGFTAEIASDIPEGSGLSSSAALEVSFLKALREAFAIPIGDLELAKLAQRVENEFVGARVGIMDQTVCALGRAGEALWIDTRSMKTESIPIPRDGLDLVVIHSGISHRNVGGGYLERREQCEEAARELGLPVLRDLEPADLGRLSALPPVLRRRARHVVTENARVIDAIAALRSRDFGKLGQLFRDSHVSLRDDFEVSIPEIDLLVRLLNQDRAVWGARMTGGGFGGSVVAVAAPSFREQGGLDHCLSEYRRLTGETPQKI